MLVCMSLRLPLRVVLSRFSWNPYACFPCLYCLGYASLCFTQTKTKQMGGGRLFTSNINKLLGGDDSSRPSTSVCFCVVCFVVAVGCLVCLFVLFMVYSCT